MMWNVVAVVAQGFINVHSNIGRGKPMPTEPEERYRKLLTDLLDIAQQVDAQLQQIINTIKRDVPTDGHAPE